MKHLGFLGLLVILALSTLGCDGDSPTSSSSSQNQAAPAAFNVDLALSKDGPPSAAIQARPAARLDTAGNRMNQVFYNVNILEANGGTGGRLLGVDLQFRDNSGTIFGEETLMIPGDGRINAGQSTSISGTISDLSLRADFVDAVAQVTGDDGNTSTVSDQTAVPVAKSCDQD